MIDERIAAEQSGAAAAGVDLADGALGKVEDRAAGWAFWVFRGSDADAGEVERDAALDDDGFQLVLLPHRRVSYRCAERFRRIRRRLDQRCGRAFEDGSPPDHADSPRPDRAILRQTKVGSRPSAKSGGRSRDQLDANWKVSRSAKVWPIACMPAGIRSSTTPSGTSTIG